MREHTQSNIDPGNCWQTAVACLLDVEPTELPDQTLFDRREVQPDGSFRYVGPYYNSALNAYLREHHGLGYVELHYPPELYTALQVREPGLHLMTGRTVRSTTNGNQRHIVVARFGELLWDPHPSRAGLLGDVNYAFLIPYPQVWRQADGGSCVCPACKE